MPEKKPCGICRRWFKPDPRAGKRQRVCSAAACQSERPRRNAAAWREQNAQQPRNLAHIHAASRTLAAHERHRPLPRS